MRNIGRCVPAAAVLAAAGLAFGQKAADRSETGEPLVREWRLASGESAAVGPAGAPGGAGLTSVFVPAGATPEADSHSSAAYLPDGSAVVVANRASRNLAVFSPNTRALIRSIPLSGSPQSLAITPDGQRAVTANLFEGTASIISLATGAELHTIPVGANPAVARVTPSGATAVVSCNGPQSLAVIDVASGAVRRTIPTGGSQTTFAINFESDGVGFQSTGPVVAGESTALYPDYTGGRILVIELGTGVTTPVATAVHPTCVAVAGSKAYVSHYGAARTVSEIDLPTRTVTRTFAVPSDLNGPIAVNGAGTRLAVAVLNATVIVDLATGAVSPALATASVNQLLTTADGNSALAVGYNGSLISYASQSIVANTNQFVSTSIGAVSPVAGRAVMFSDTFGEDMIVVGTGGNPGLLNAGPTGPAPEADKTRVAALTPDGSKAIAVNQFSQTATIVATATGQVLATVPTGRRPGDVRITPNGARAVIANRDGAAATVVNLSTYATAEVPISTRADQVRISPDGRYAYLAVVVNDGVWRIDLNTMAAAGPMLPTGNMGSYFQGRQSFSGIALSGGGGRLVTCDSFDHRLTVIDTAAWAVTGTVQLPAGSFPVRAVFSPDDARIYVSNRDGDTVTVLGGGGATPAVLGSIAVGDAPTEMAISPDGSRLYVVTTGTNPGVSVVNTGTMTQTSAITFAENPAIDGIALSPDGARLYISHSGGSYTLAMGGFSVSQSNRLSVIDAASGAVLEEMPGANLASGLAISANGSLLAMPNLMSEGLTVVSVASCYANCDGSTGLPVLNILDFVCFQERFAAASPVADCNRDGSINVADFVCFQGAFAAGCR